MFEKQCVFAATDLFNLCFNRNGGSCCSVPQIVSDVHFKPKQLSAFHVGINIVQLRTHFSMYVLECRLYRRMLEVKVTAVNWAMFYAVYA